MLRFPQEGGLKAYEQLKVVFDQQEEQVLSQASILADLSLISSKNRSYRRPTYEQFVSLISSKNGPYPRPAYEQFLSLISQ